MLLTFKIKHSNIVISTLHIFMGVIVDAFSKIINIAKQTDSNHNKNYVTTIDNILKTNNIDRKAWF